jgi:two-component system, NtrC family, sensor histidine kinase KinB
MFRSLSGRVALIALVTLIGSSLFEVAVHLIGVDRSVGSLHLATIVLNTIVAAVAARVVLRKHDALRQRLLEQETLARGRAEAALAWELDANREIANLAAALLTAPPTEDGADLVLQAAQRVTASEYGYVGYIDPQTGRLKRSILSRSVWDTCEIPAKDVVKAIRGLSGWVLENRKPLFSNDPASDPRSAGTPPGHVPIVRFLSAPVLAGDALLGQIALANAPHEYIERHFAVVQRLADLYGLALQRKWAEEAVRQSEERYRNLYEGIPVGLYRTSLGGQILDGNQALVRLLGCPDRATLLSMNATDFYIDPNERQRQGTLLRERGLVQGVDMQLRRLDGQTIWVRNSMRGVRDADKRILHHEGSLEDVTERHLADEAEHEQRAFADALRDTSAALASTRSLEEVLDIILDGAGKVVPHSASTIMLIEGDMARVVRSRGFVEPGLEESKLDRCAALTRWPDIREVLATGQAVVIADTQQYPGWISFQDSSWIRSHLGVPIRVKGQFIGLLNLHSPTPGFFHGVDAERLQVFADQVGAAVENARLYQTTLDERTRLQALIDSSRDGILLSSTEGRIMTLNQPALRLLHLPGCPADWLGRPVREELETCARHAPEAAQNGLTELARLLEEQGESAREGTFSWSERTVYWLNLPVRVSDAPIGRLVVLRDVTEERAAEQLREDMTYMLLHDLRNPLSNISNALELLCIDADRAYTTDEQAVLEIARANAHKMRQLVDAILEVSRLESGHVALDRVPLALDTLIAETLSLQAPLAVSRRLRLANHVPPGLPEIRGDRQLMGRVLQNLVDNAIKFTPDGGAVSIAVRVDWECHPALLRVSVTNDGPEIPGDVRQRLFQKFSRGRQEGRGNGLGLAFCKLAVEAHGGRIWVDTAHGQGTTLVFALPITV